MKDRIPTYPGRVKLVPVDGQENTYDLTMADAPTEEGTPFNKANILSDSTMKSLSMSEMTDEEAAASTPDDAFEAIGLWIAFFQVAVIKLRTDAIDGTSVEANSDINDCTDPGRYIIESNAIAVTCSNLPVVANGKAVAGYLEVFALGKTGYILQRFTPYSNAGVFTRTYYPGNTSWGSWLKYSGAAVDTYTPAST